MKKHFEFKNLQEKFKKYLLITGASNEAGGSSDEEEDDEEGNTEEPQPQPEVKENEGEETGSGAGAGGPDSEKEAVPLVDYIHNVMKFVDAILSNNATDDHCRLVHRFKNTWRWRRGHFNFSQSTL